MLQFSSFDTRKPPHLNAQCGIILFKKIIPDIKASIHSCGEKDSRANRTPTTISKVCCVLPGEKEGKFVTNELQMKMQEDQTHEKVN